jgi:AcrR family transcriptional regulator
MYRSRTPATEPAERVLNVAGDLFYQRGISAVGVDTIVAASGVSKATLYRHYHSRDLLVVACLRRGDEIWRGWLLEGIEQRASDPRGKLLAIFDWLQDWFASDGFRGCAFLNAAAELRPDHPAHPLPLEHKDAVHDLIAGLAKEAAVRRPKQLADEFMLLIDGAISHALLEASSKPALRAKRLATLTLEDHLAGRAGGGKTSR